MRLMLPDGGDVWMIKGDTGEGFDNVKCLARR